MAVWVRLARVVAELPISRVKLQRFCPLVLVNSVTCRGSREESTFARKVEHFLRRALEFGGQRDYTFSGAVDKAMLGSSAGRAAYRSKSSTQKDVCHEKSGDIVRFVGDVGGVGCLRFA